MGANCSSTESDNAEEKGNDAHAARPTLSHQQYHQHQRYYQQQEQQQQQRPPSRKLTKRSSNARKSTDSDTYDLTGMDMGQHSQMIADAQDVIASRKRVTVLDIRRSLRTKAGGILPGVGGTPATTGSASAFADAADYESQRAEIVRREGTIAFDFRSRARATRQEQRADEILGRLRRRDAARVYGSAPVREGYGGQLHARFAGDHFLSNVELIEQTELYAVARRMPKGAHLHIHFNAGLLPHVLLDIAKTMRCMFVTSDLPLVADKDYVNYDRCEIQFSILSPEREKPGDLFSPAYQPRQTMRFKEFLERFGEHNPNVDVDRWLESKLVFSEQEAHNPLQTAAGAWQKFNGRTRMMKGLFNYATAYRRYTRQLLESFAAEHVQYAEIRPNFMKTNQLWNDEGTELIDNEGIMELIIGEVERYRAENPHADFAGLKVIYCTPRSFSNELVRHALRECIQFKKKWPRWIAGFDLVGEETAGRPLSAFVPELLEFRRECDAEGLDIPFLFHCGETLDVGSEADGNLIDALLLNSRRIGHGFALARHPYVMEHMKKRGVCLELCPISNEILGLTPRVGGHAMYNLLANNVHCTVSSDNGTLFRSTLSHDFYQVMVGKVDMTLFGWKQLVEWSLQHSCMTDDERRAVQVRWRVLWEEFVDWIVETYGDVEEPLAEEAAK